MATPAKKRSARERATARGRAKDKPRAASRARRGAQRASGRAATTAERGNGPRRWSAGVTRSSNALDLEPGVFKLRDPKAVARSLERSARRSTRRKSDPYRSAMSMLTFYLNRAGRNVEARQRRVLERAKDELRRLFGREPGAARRRA